MTRGRPLRVLLDMDGILVDLLQPWLAEFSATSGITLRVEDITDARLHHYVPEDHRQRLYDVLLQPGWVEALTPLPGALDAVDTMLERGYEPVIVSAAMTATHAQEKFRWARRHLPESMARDLVITQRKDVVYGDVLVDDLPWNIEAYRAAWPQAQVLSVGYPYNRDAPLHLWAPSWRDTEAAWATLLEHLEGMAEG